jgi:hypothetical protein
MRTRLVPFLSAFALAVMAPAVALAADAQAPPLLTPTIADSVSAACPGTAPYASALVRGITSGEAAAAEPKFAACAKQIRLVENQWKNDAADVALGAVELARGLLNHDPAMLQRAADATAALRAVARGSDADVRAWPTIPDFVDGHTGDYVVDGCGSGSAALNAAYINVAARTGVAWVLTPRAPARCGVKGYPYAYNGRRDPFARPDPWTASPGRFSWDQDPTSRPSPAVDPTVREFRCLGGPH